MQSINILMLCFLTPQSWALDQEVDVVLYDTLCPAEHDKHCGSSSKHTRPSHKTASGDDVLGGRTDHSPQGKRRGAMPT